MRTTTAEATTSPIVETTRGRVRGTVEDGIAVFRGIPYAEPPVGRLRFRPPERRRPWQGVLDATRFGDCHPQDPNPVENALMLADRRPPEGNDCLNLNVWTTDPGGAGMPVLVWIHGGSLKFGSGADAVYDGATFARDGIVTVTLNYRLHPAGYLFVGDRPGSGAFGLLDQIAVLEWVQENIAAFGGDPDAVTVAGESAGGHSVGQLLAAPAARGLFRRAIPQSGAASFDVPVDAARAIGDAVLDRLGIRGHDDDAIAEIASDALLEASRAVESTMAAVLAEYGLRPNLMSAATRDTSLSTYGGDVMPVRALDAIAAGGADGVDVLIGTTLDETRLFGPQFAATAPAIADVAFGPVGGSAAEVLRTYGATGTPGSELDAGWRFMTDVLFRVPAIRLAEALHGHGSPTYMYLLTYGTPPSANGQGAIHGLDVPLMWDRVDEVADAIFAAAGVVERPYGVAAAMHGVWSAFVKTGVPQHDSLPGWPRYDLDRRATMQLDTESTVVHDPMGEQRRLWQGVQY